MSFDMDAYREAFDIHGEEVECDLCGAKMDSLSVEHWRDTYNMHGECDGSVPICDRCHWDEYYSDRDMDD